MKVLEAIVFFGAYAVSASALSLISAAAARSVDQFAAGLDDDDVPVDLLSALPAITDPQVPPGCGISWSRCSRWRCVVLAGARSYVAVAE